MTAEAQLATYFADLEPELAEFGKALRAKLRKRLPGLFEVVYLYARQGKLANGYEALCSLALHANSVQLFFAQGPQLAKADPQKLLQGRGKTARYVALQSLAEFDRQEVEALLAAAVSLAELRLDPKAKGTVIIKAEEQKRRTQRADSKASRPRQTSARRRP
jgi:hypothetical protein